MNHDLADNLLRLRKARGLTQEQLAGQLGVSPQSVSKWENCQSYPDIELLPHLAEVFSVSIDALLGYRREKLRTSQYESKYRSPAYYWGNDVWSGCYEVLRLIRRCGRCGCWTWAAARGRRRCFSPGTATRSPPLT